MRIINADELLEKIRWLHFDNSNQREKVINTIEKMPTVSKNDFFLEPNYNACRNCAFYKTEEWEMPCLKCRRMCKDYWRSEEK